MTDLDRAELRRLEQRHQDGFGDISRLVRGMRAALDEAEWRAEKASAHLALVMVERDLETARAEAAEAAVERVRAYIESDPSVSLEPMSPGAIILAALAPVTEEGDKE